MGQTWQVPVWKGHSAGSEQGTGQNQLGMGGDKQWPGTALGTVPHGRRERPQGGTQKWASLRAHKTKGSNAHFWKLRAGLDHREAEKGLRGLKSPSLSFPAWPRGSDEGTGQPGSLLGSRGPDDRTDDTGRGHLAHPLQPGLSLPSTKPTDLRPCWAAPEFLAGHQLAQPLLPAAPPSARPKRTFPLSKLH